MATTSLAGPAEAVRALRRDSLGYLWSLGVPALGQLCLLPLLVACLTPRELGALALIEALMTPAATLAMMGLKFAYLYRFARADEAEQARVFGTCLGLGCALSTGIGLLLAVPLMAPGCWRMLGVDEPVMHQPAWLVLALVTGTLQGLLITWLRAEREVTAAGIAGQCQLVAHLAVSAFAVGVASLGVDGLYLGQCCGSLVALSVLIRTITRQRGLHSPPWRFDRREVHPVLAYGWPLTISLLVRYSMDSLARLLLVRLVSIEAAGLWLVTTRIVSLFDILVSNPVLMAWGGLMHHALREARAAIILRAVASEVLVWSSIAALLLTLARPPLLHWLAEGVGMNHAWLFFWLLMAKWLVVAKSPLTSGVYLTGETTWAARNNGLSLLIFGVAAPVLATAFDAEGLAAAIVLATLLPAIHLWWQANRLVRQRLSPTGVAVTLSAWAMMMLSAAVDLPL